MVSWDHPQNEPSEANEYCDVVIPAAFVPVIFLMCLLMVYY